MMENVELAPENLEDVAVRQHIHMEPCMTFSNHPSLSLVIPCPIAAIMIDSSHANIGKQLYLGSHQNSPQIPVFAAQLSL